VPKKKAGITPGKKAGKKLSENEQKKQVITQVVRENPDATQADIKADKRWKWPSMPSGRSIGLAKGTPTSKGGRKKSSSLTVADVEASLAVVRDFYKGDIEKAVKELTALEKIGSISDVLAGIEAYKNLRVK